MFKEMGIGKSKSETIIMKLHISSDYFVDTVSLAMIPYWDCGWEDLSKN